MSLLQIADYVVICVMMAISAGVGIYFRLTGGRQKTTLEFLMADKNMTVFPVAFSVLATMMSAISILGTPAESYLYGTQMLIREFSYPFGACIAAYYILPVYFENDVKTIYGYLEKRFGKTIMLIVSLLFVVQMILYMPIAIYAPSLALNLLTGISLWASVISVAVVCTFYSSLGGLKAVLWTDLFQGSLMLLAIFALIIKGSLDFGGFYKVFETAQDGQRLELFNFNMDFTIRYTFWNTFTHGLIQALYLNGSTFTIIQRLMSCGDVRKAQLSLLWSILLCCTFQAAVCLLGITMYSYFKDCDPISDKVVKTGDQLVPLFVVTLFGHIPGLPGFCVAGILSGALSTMSSVVNCLVAVTLEDYIRPFMHCKNLTDSRAASVAKCLALFYGALCLLLTFVIANAKGLLEAAVLILGIVGGPTFGVFYLGMFTTTANESGALIGLMSGIAFTGWIGFGSLYNKSKYPPFPLSTAGCDSILNNTSFDEMIAANVTSAPEVLNNTFNITHSTGRYIFPLYKISFFWISFISFITTAAVGYTISAIVGLYRTKKVINPKHLSPLVRRWLCKIPEPDIQKEELKLVSNQDEKDEILDEL